MRCDMLCFVGLLLFTSSGTAQDKSGELTSVMKYAEDHSLFNGSMAVLEKGKVIFKWSSGYSNFLTGKKTNENTRYELASVSKQFTAMCILMLREQGRLALTDSIGKYVPGLPYHHITLQHLLNHTSGLPDYIKEIAFVSWDENRVYHNADAVDELIRHRLPVHFTPGEKFEYCNTGYMLLAVVVEKVSGQSFETFLTENIFKPLGMSRSGIFPRYTDGTDHPNTGYGFIYDVNKGRFELPENIPQLARIKSMAGVYGDGLIGSTLEDMIKWELALSSDKLIRQSVVREMFTSGLLNNGQPCGYGQGWFLQMDPTDGPVAQHTGGWSGVRNAVVRWLEKDRVLIVLRNNDIEFRGIQDAVKNILNGQPYQMPKASLTQVLALASASGGVKVIREKYEGMKAHHLPVSEEEMNLLGYQLMEVGKPELAVEVLLINSEQFPDSWNAFDSLGEVCRKTGNLADARKYYQKSLDLNPQNEAARKALTELGK